MPVAQFFSQTTRRFIAVLFPLYQRTCWLSHLPELAAETVASPSMSHISTYMYLSASLR